MKRREVTGRRQCNHRKYHGNIHCKIFINNLACQGRLCYSKVHLQKKRIVAFLQVCPAHEVSEFIS